jgi:predicted nucleic acid-binding protein
LTLNPTVMGKQFTRAEAVGTLRALRALPGHRFLADDTSLADAAVDLIGFVGHRQATDMHLVNLAARHGVVLATFDKAIRLALVPGEQRLVEFV